MNSVLYRPPLTVPLSGRDHVRGPATAHVTLLEYGDYQCPFCRSAYVSLKQVFQILGDELRFAYRHFPLTQIHPHAQQAAEAAEAAARQGRFWEMHAQLFEHQSRLGSRDLLRYAEVIGLDVVSFLAELNEHVHAPRVRADFLSGVRSGVNGTPTFFINGLRHDGGYDVESLVTALQASGS